MREIKFRAWNKYTKTLFVATSLALDKWWKSMGVVGYDEEGNLFDLEVMQYTGLKDCRGIEYYEGDLVSNNLGTDKESIREVRFIDGCWKLVRIKGNSRLPKEILLAEFCGLNMPVVGNIHSNPELLEPQK